ncbi:hypothetical protein [Modestobacter lapidis]|nr:hypothetical protein [Modestobacter lapidis]
MSAARPAQPSSDPATGASGAPTSARVAVVVLAVVGALLLISALLTWGGRDGVVEQYLRAQPDATRADADLLVLLNVVQGLVFGLPAVVSAWFLAHRHGWARWAGLVTCGLLGLLTVWVSAGAGGIAVSSLLLLVLCVAAASSLLAPTTAAWTQTGARGRA